MSDGHIFKALPENNGIWVFKQDDSETDYRKNGHAAILADGGHCNRYKTPVRIRAALKAGNSGQGTNPSTSLAPIGKLSPEHIERYYFEFAAAYIQGKRTGQVIPNFSRSGTPYANQAHHLIPQAQYLGLFGDREREMLKRVDYNVHNGRNIIFLPAHAPDTRFHNLPYHMGSHPKYDKQVKADAKKLSKDLKKLSKAACDEPKVAAIKRELYELQEDYWTMLANEQPIKVNDVIFKNKKTRPGR
ncbi:hypothetical protein D7V97_37880 [Corallococcus sp. CA053C]|uniref:AHH domain-containing protein n=1 Tax=Corallococcus sp. CA053C TaxID=2316732 RepID=UPI000EA0A552|nr:AHH domain-containing protein [Corallococcus sp. CA053C]RKG95069.1 hypothetical protein D7V97_37880 [Corallococcus sp. CA053C]